MTKLRETLLLARRHFSLTSCSLERNPLRFSVSAADAHPKPVAQGTRIVFLVTCGQADAGVAEIVARNKALRYRDLVHNLVLTQSSC
jgi:hypothetical protein